MGKLIATLLDMPVVVQVQMARSNVFIRDIPQYGNVLKSGWDLLIT